MAIGSVRKPDSTPDGVNSPIILADRRPKRDEPTTKGGGDDPPPGPPPGERKFAAKRWNEGVKVFATWMNTLATATITAAFIVPAVQGLDSFVLGYRVAWVFVGIGLHVAGQAVIRLEMRSEE